MSRLGKKPVEIPAGVKVQLEGRRVRVEGPKGNLNWEHHPGVRVAVEARHVSVERVHNDRVSRCLHGTTRQLLQNMMTGVSKGFQRDLDIVGVGYNAKLDKGGILLQIGFCHPVHMPLPEGVQAEIPQPTRIVVKGADKQAVGQFAAEVRGIRPPEPYKGKGIRYSDEVVRRKQAKSSFG